MKTTATFVKDVSENFTGSAALYQLDPPLEGYAWDDEEAPKYDYVVVSATTAMYGGPETYIFGADDSGNIQEWGELPGSYKGGLNHVEALEGAGYSVIEFGKNDGR